jgi:GLPGLI family protein
VLIANNDRGQFVCDLKQKKFKIGEYDAEQRELYYVHDYYPQNNMVKELVYFRKHQMVAEWEYQASWTITDDTDVVLGYQVIKAFKNDSATGGKLFAWFAPDIALPYGPYRDNGLPGLILKVIFEKINTVTTAISINKKNDVQFINTNDNAIAVSKEVIISRDENEMKRAINDKR